MANTPAPTALLSDSSNRVESETPTADPFYHSPPSSSVDGAPDSPSLTSLMAAIRKVQQITPQRTATVSATPPRASRHGSVARRLGRQQCTHMHVRRARGLTCSHCHRLSEHGWVYQCHQDHVLPQNGPLPDVDTMPLVPDGTSYFEAKAQVAEHLQMDSSVVRGIRNGDYDVDQVDKLIKQKEKGIQSIIEAGRGQGEAGGVQSEARSQLTSQPLKTQDIIASVGSRPTPPSPYKARQASRLAPPQTDASEMSSALQQNSTSCNYTVCQWCRGYFQDRLWVSFESVLEGEAPPLTEYEWRTLPMMDPRITSSIGLRATPSPVLRSFHSEQSMDITLHDTSDEISVDWSPSTTGGETDSGSEPLDSSELFPCPGPLRCPVWSRQSGCAYDGGFEDGKRAENHGYLSRLTPSNSNIRLGQFADLTPGGSSPTASSISLPTTPTSPSTPLFTFDEKYNSTLQEQCGKARSVPGDMGGDHHKIGSRDNDSAESFGSELEVDGGVALTEEAVEQRLPDIAND